jgi:hypothetical protein
MREAPDWWPEMPPPWSEYRAAAGSRWWLYPFALKAWAMRCLAVGLRRSVYFELLELAGRCTVLVAVIVWFYEADDRAKERRYRAWELINSARDSVGDGGRRDALEELNGDQVSLAAAPLQKAWLAYIDLRGADLHNADLQGTYLENANLQGADLREANLRGAILANTDLRYANLYRADLQGVGLLGTHLQGAFLVGANLQGAVFKGTDLQNVDFGGADLRGAELDQEQLDAAGGNERTKLPEGLVRPAHWSVRGIDVTQPDDTTKP